MKRHARGVRGFDFRAAGLSTRQFGALLLTIGMMTGRAWADLYLFDGGGINSVWTTGANWDHGDTAPPSGAGHIVYYNAALVIAKRTQTLGQDYSIGAIQFGATSPGGAIVVSAGNTLTLTSTTGILMGTAPQNLTLNCDVMLGANQTWTVGTAAARTLTVGGKLSGSYAIDKQGAGTVSLASANNDFVGDITLSQGTLTLGADGTLGSTGNGVIVSGNGQITANTVTTLASTRTLTIGSGITATVSTTANALEMAGKVTGSGGNLTKIGAGTLYLSHADNDYTGTTRITLGVLRANHDAGLPPGSNLVLGGGVLMGDGVVTFSRGVGTLGGEVQWSGSGGFAARAAQMTINLGSGAALVWGTAPFVTTGTLILSHSTSDSLTYVQNSVDLVASGAATRTVQVDNGSAAIDAELAGAITDTGTGSFTKTGDGTLVFGNAANAFTGTLRVQDGTLRVSDLSANVNGAGAISFGGAAADDGTLEYTGPVATCSRAMQLVGVAGSEGALAASGTGALTLSGGISTTAAGTKTFTLTGTSTGANTVSGVIANGTATLNLTKAGVGTWTLSNANTYTGITTINGGILEVSSLEDGGVACNIGQAASAAANLVLSGGTLRYTGSTTSINRDFTLGTASSTSGIDIPTDGATLTMGNFTVTAASITLNVTGGSGSGLVLGTGTLSANTTTFYPTTATLAVGAVAATATARNIVLSGTASGNTLSGYTGAFANTLTKNDTGAWTLKPGTYQFTGATTVNQGTLTLEGALDAVTGSAVTVGPVSPNSATLNLNVVDAISIKTLTVNGTGSGLVTESVANALSGTAALTISTAGATVVLSKANDYSGATSLTLGTLRLEDAGSIGGSASLGFVSGTLELRNDSATSFATPATFSLTTTAAKTIDVRSLGGGSDHTLTLGDFTLAASAACTLNVTGADGYALALGNGSLSSALTFNPTTASVSIAGLTAVGAARAVTLDGTASGNSLGAYTPNTYAGTVTKQNSSTWTLTGVHAYTGATAVNSGTLTITGTLGNTAVTVGAATLELNGAGAINQNTLTVNNASAVVTENTANALSGTAALTITAGTVTLSQANDYSGNTSLSTGALNLTAAGAISAGTATYTSGTLNLAVANALSGAAALTLNGPALTLVNDNDYSGITTITAGTLAISAATQIGTSTAVNALSLGGGTLNTTADLSLGSKGVTLTVASSIDVDSGTTLQIPGVVAGGQFALTKKGLGTLVLSGPNTWGTATGNMMVINAGTLSIGSDENLGNALIDLQFTGSGTLAVTSGFTLGNGRVITIAAGQTGTFDIGNGETLVVQTAIGTGTGALTKTGGGTLQLNAACGYTGLTDIQAGTLKYGAVINTLSSGPVSVSGGTLDMQTFTDSVGAVTVSNGGTITGSGAAVLTTTSNPFNMQDGTVEIPLAGAVGIGLTKTTAGTVTLSAVNTYPGATVVNDGTLVIQSPGSTTAGSAVTVTAPGALAGTGTILGGTVVHAGARLAPGIPGVAGGTLTTGPAANLTLNQGSICAFEVDADEVTCDALVIGKGPTGLIINGTTDTTFLNLYDETGADLVVTGARTYTLIDYGTVGTVANVDALDIGNKVTGQNYQIVDDGPNHVITVTVTSGSTINISDASIAEGNIGGSQQLTFTVTVSPVDANDLITVDYATVPGTAKSDAPFNDYTAIPTTQLVIPPNTPSVDITVDVTGDVKYEPNETLTVVLSNPNGFNAIIDGTGVGTINNDDSQGGLWYVDDSATGTGAGYNWDDAFTTIEAAITAGTAGEEVWVAAGTYQPGALASSTYTLKANVPVFGGFAGGETARTQRDWTANPTILNGEIGTGATTDNINKLVTAAVNSTLDGFRLTRNYALGGGHAAVSVVNAGPVTIRNCTFTDNALGASGAAGAVYYSYASGTAAFTLDRCTFIANTSAHTHHGAIVLAGAANEYATVQNCVFSGNTSSGVAANSLSTVSGDPGDVGPLVVNCTFANNSGGYDVVLGSSSSSNEGSCRLRNCIFRNHLNPVRVRYDTSYLRYQNLCVVQYVAPPPGDNSSFYATNFSPTVVDDGGGATSFAGDPRLRDEDGADDTVGTLDDDVQIWAGSPCIDAGTATGAPGEDYLGLARPQDGDNRGSAVIDIGAYEYAFRWLCTATVSGGVGGSVDGVPSDGYVLPGDAITFTAYPNSGFEVDRWEDPFGSVAQTGGNTYTINNVLGARAVVLFFKPTAGNVAVRVQTAPAGLGLTFTADAVAYAELYDFGLPEASGLPLEVTAGTEPAGQTVQYRNGSEYTFASWATGGNPQIYTVPVGGGTQTANFTTKHGLTIVVAPTRVPALGSIVQPGAGTTYHTPNATVTIEASPATGSFFVNWTGDAVTDANAALTTLNIGNSPKSVTANFLRVIRVDGSLPSDGDGTTWGTAYKYLASALATAGSGDEIWVKGGLTYKPVEASSYFTLPAGVGLYGGFAGTEVTRAERTNPTATPALLSGDINGNNQADVGPDCQKILLITGADTVVDGFTISHAANDDALGTSGSVTGGGAIRINSSGSITIRNCTFTGNVGDYGGCIASYGSYTGTLLIENSLFYGNSHYTADQGSCVGYIRSSQVVYLRNCTSLDNVNAHDDAAWQVRAGPTVYIENTIMLEDMAAGAYTTDNDDGPAYWSSGFKRNNGNSSVTVYAYNSCFLSDWSGSSVANGGNVGNVYVSTLDGPAFVNRALNNYLLTGSSLCVDGGDNARAAATDIRGNARPLPAGHVVDIGAYEMVLPTVSNALPQVDVTSAYLNGYLYATAGDPPTVEVYYGAVDAGMTTTIGVGNWEGKFTFSGPQSVGSLVSDAIALPATSTNFYRYYAYNSVGHYWSRPARGVNTAGTHSHGLNLKFNDNADSLYSAPGWYGDGGGYVASLGDIATTKEGAFMYQPSSGGGSDCDERQVIALPASLESAILGGATYDFTGYYNIPTGSDDATIYQITATFRNAANGTLRADTTGQLTTDSDPATWEGFHLSGSVPVGTASVELYMKWHNTTGEGAINGVFDDFSFAVNVIANLSPPRTVTWTIDPVDGGTIDPVSGSIFADGTLVHVVATPADGYVFSSWTGDLAGQPADVPPFNIGADLAATAHFAVPSGGPTLYVDDTATGANNGTSWGNAYTSLGTAIANALGQDIWVAAGTYKPGPTHASTFTTKPGVNYYGGFAGNETALNQRNVAANPTILSGDVNGNDVAHDTSRNENNYHVLTVTSGIMIDGFVISGGAAFFDDGDGGVFPGNTGAGIYCVNASPLITNCTFVGNSARIGGGMAVSGASSAPVIADCLFIDNKIEFQTSSYGAGLAVLSGAAATVERCVFSGAYGRNSGGGVGANGASGVTMRNSLLVGNFTWDGSGALYGGGAIKLNNTPATLVNCTLANNRTAGNGGALWCSGTTAAFITNSIFWGSVAALSGNEIYLSGSAVATVAFSDVSGGYAGGNLDSDPQFVGTVASGTWASVTPFSAVTRQTVLTASGSPGWTVNALAGLTVNPDTTQNREFVIVANDANSLTVWGYADAVGAATGSFAIKSYRLGAFYPSSPCFDAGAVTAPGDDLSGAVRPQGGGVDLGAYEAVAWQLTMSTAGVGSGTPSPAVGTHWFVDGTVVALTATPGPYMEFYGWFGAGLSGQASPQNLTMDADKSVTANFFRRPTLFLFK